MTIEDLTKIKDGLSKYNQEEVKFYLESIVQEMNAKDKNGNLKNSFYKNLTSLTLVKYFQTIKNEGLIYDNKHVRIGFKGIEYDYVAYKNKMLSVYPDSKIDLQLVYKDDTFSVEKSEDGIKYKHIFGNTFNRTNEDIIGGYCIIKNQRGEFITTLSKEDLNKHRKIAKTQNIWNEWFVEMCMKTIFKKATKFHFDDIFETMNEEDNKEIDLSKSGITDKDNEIAEKINEIKTSEELAKFYNDNKDKVENKAIFNKLITNKKNEIQNS